MLTETEIYENKVKYLKLLQKLNIDPTQIIKFLDNTDYFNKPLTSQNFGAYRGGLCEHALKLARELKWYCDMYRPDTYSTEDILKVALFRDIYKAILYEETTKNVKNETTGEWETVTVFKNMDDRPSFGSIWFSSYMIIKNFMELSDEVIEAILYGEFKGQSCPDIQIVRKDYTLTVLTGLADIACYYLV